MIPFRSANDNCQEFSKVANGFSFFGCLTGGAFFFFFLQEELSILERSL